MKKLLITAAVALGLAIGTTATIMMPSATTALASCDTCD